MSEALKIDAAAMAKKKQRDAKETTITIDEINRSKRAVVVLMECYCDMIQGGLDGMNDALSGLPRSGNENRSHSYSYAYSDGYTSAQTLRARPRDKVAEELAIKVDMG